VHDADAAVHRLMERGGAAVKSVAAAFPGVERGGAIDRGLLGARVLGDDMAMKRLEAILHPLVRAEAHRFLALQARLRRPLAVLDIPLLFETGGDQFVDITLVVSAPEEVQTSRLMARPGMTPEKLEALRSRQMPDAQKRARADYVIDTGLPLDETLTEVDKLLESFKNRTGEKFALWRKQNDASAGEG